MKKRKKTLKQLINNLKNMVIKPRAPHKTTKHHQDKSKYSKKIKHQKPYF